MKLDALTLFDSVLSMLVPVLFGVVAFKTKLITEDFSRVLSRFVLYIAQPMLLVNSLNSVECNKENLKTALLITIASILVHAVAAAVAFLVTKPFKNLSEGRICEFCMIFSNCGFFGFPLLKTVYGDVGLFWGGVYAIFFNMLTWSYGLYLLYRANRSIKINLRKIFLNAATIPSAVGILFWLFHVKLYPPILTSMQSIANTCTPLSMVVIGIMISKLPLKKLVFDVKPYLSSVIKLVLLPVLVGCLLAILGFSADIATFGALMIALPSAAIAAMFGETHGVAPVLGAQTVGISTLLSIATVPLVMQLVSFLIHRLV